MKRLFVFHLLFLTVASPQAWSAPDLSSVEIASTVPAMVAASTPVAVPETVATSTISVAPSTSTTAGPVVHGIHLTASAAGSKRYRANHLEPMLANTVINAIVVDIKEEDGWVYVPGVKMAQEAGAYAADIPDLASWLADLKRRHIYTVGRVVSFKDNKAPRHFKNLGVHTINGDLWQDKKRITWLDPYNQQAWRYDFLVAVQAARLGFDEIQFDYIRFPTDGNVTAARFVKPYSPATASQALVDFLHQATQLLRPLGVKVSIDVFGLTTTVNTGMGIGQRISPMTAEVDYVCPMTYPSHYAKGEYGIPNPNDQPYHTIHLAVRDALKTLGPDGVRKLRPYYQDFSLKGRGIRYGPDEVRAQIQAAVDLGVGNWTLWNASCKYTVAALTNPFEAKPLPKYLQGTAHPRRAKKALSSAPATAAPAASAPTAP